MDDSERFVNEVEEPVINAEIPEPWEEEPVDKLPNPNISTKKYRRRKEEY